MVEGNSKISTKYLVSVKGCFKSSCFFKTAVLNNIFNSTPFQEADTLCMFN